MTNTVLEKYFSEKNLELAWERVLRWSDKTTKDHFGIKSFRLDFKKNIKHLNYKLTVGLYEPTRPLKFYVPKSSYMQRTKSVLLIEDEFANSIKTDDYYLYLAEIFEMQGNIKKSLNYLNSAKNYLIKKTDSESKSNLRQIEKKLDELRLKIV